jgi:hypothetical protein
VGVATITDTVTVSGCGCIVLFDSIVFKRKRGEERIY